MDGSDFLQLMENGLAVLEGTDMAKDLTGHGAGIESILTDPIRPVGIGTDGDDLSPQLLEAQ